MENVVMYDVGEGISALPFDNYQSPSFGFETPQNVPQYQQSTNRGVMNSRGIITAEQWDNAKPFIQTLYMEENKPLPYVAKALREEHGFYPTKKQFMRKVCDQWGLKKNANSAQRKAIVAQLGSSSMMQSSQTLMGESAISRPLSNAKIDRWKKEMHRQCASVVTSKSSSSNSISGQGKRELNSVVFGTTVSIPGSNISNIQLGPITESTAMLDDFTESQAVSTLSGTEAQLQPDWTTSHIIDSPQLSRLFTDLHISGFHGYEDDIPPLSLEERPSPTLPLQESEKFLNANQIQDLQLYHEPSHERKSYATGPITLLDNQKESVVQIDSQNTYPQGFQSLIPTRQISIDPFREIYPFPNSSGNPSTFLSWQGFADLKNAHITWEQKYNILSGNLPTTNLAMISIMGNLVDIFWEQGKYAQAESFTSKMLPAMIQKFGASDQRTLYMSLRSVEIATFQGHHDKAEALHKAVHAALLQNFHFCHPAVIKSLVVYAGIKYDRWQTDEAEVSYRQAFQLYLNLYGPKHPETLKVMGRLAVALLKQEQQLQSEQLLRVVLQLQDQVTQHQTAEKLYSAQSFGYLLAKQGNFRKSSEWYDRVLQASIDKLGENHPDTLNCLLDIAELAKSQGETETSIQMLETIIPKINKTLGSQNIQTLYAKIRLAQNLLGLNEFQRATSYYEEALPRYIHAYGAEHEETLTIHYNLGYCYWKQNLFSEARDHYEKSYLGHKKTFGAEDYRTLNSLEFLGWYEKELEITSQASDME